MKTKFNFLIEQSLLRKIRKEMVVYGFNSVTACIIYAVTKLLNEKK